MPRPQNIHNKIYEALQEKYLKTRNPEILANMYDVARTVSFNYIKKYCERKGIRLNDIYEKSHDAALFVIEQHLKKPDFKVKRISAYVYFGSIKVLFSGKDAEIKETSYEEYMEKVIGTNEEIHLPLSGV
jgi:hypothetical protein